MHKAAQRVICCCCGCCTHAAVSAATAATAATAVAAAAVAFGSVCVVRVRRRLWLVVWLGDGLPPPLVPAAGQLWSGTCPRNYCYWAAADRIIAIIVVAAAAVAFATTQD